MLEFGRLWRNLDELCSIWDFTPILCGCYFVRCIRREWQIQLKEDMPRPLFRGEMRVTSQTCSRQMHFDKTTSISK